MVGAAEDAVTERRRVGHQDQRREAVAGTGPERLRRPGCGEAGGDVADRGEAGADPIDRAVDRDAEDMGEQGGQQDQDIDRPGPMQRQAFGCPEPVGHRVVPAAAVVEVHDAQHAHIAVGIDQTVLAHHGAVLEGEEDMLGDGQGREQADQQPGHRARGRSGLRLQCGAGLRFAQGLAFRSKTRVLALQKLIAMPAIEPKATPSSGCRRTGSENATARA